MCIYVCYFLTVLFPLLLKISFHSLLSHFVMMTKPLGFLAYLALSFPNGCSLCQCTCCVWVCCLLLLFWHFQFYHVASIFTGMLLLMIPCVGCFLQCFHKLCQASLFFYAYVVLYNDYKIIKYCGRPKYPNNTNRNNYECNAIYT